MAKYYVRYFEPEAYKENHQKQTIQGTSGDSLLKEEKYITTDLPWREYSRFIKYWDLLVLSADLTTIIGDVGILDLQVDFLFQKDHLTCLDLP